MVAILGDNLRVWPAVRARFYVFSRKIAMEQTKTPLKLSLFLSYFSPENLGDFLSKKPKVFDRQFFEV